MLAASFRVDVQAALHFPNKLSPWQMRDELVAILRLCWPLAKAAAQKESCMGAERRDKDASQEIGSDGWYRRRTVEIDGDRQRKEAAERQRWIAETPRRSASPSAAPAPEQGGAWGAGLRGALDEATFGANDFGSAVFNASLRKPGESEDWRQRFEAARQEELRRDLYDQEHHPNARAAGRVAGAASTLLVPGLGEVAAARAVGASARAAPNLARLIANANASKRMAPMVETSREVATRLAARTAIGATASPALQAGTDMLVEGHLGSAGRYERASLAGGMNTGLAGVLGPTLAGGLVGGGQALYDHARRGDLISRDAAVDVGAAMLAGLGASRLGDKSGRYAIQNASPAAKGRVGEKMSEARSTIRGEGVQTFKGANGKTTTHTDIVLPSGLRSVADHVTKLGEVVEAKFGLHAKLSKAQKDAARVLQQNYRIDHWLPRDFGKITGSAFGMFAPPHREERPPEKRR